MLYPSLNNSRTSNCIINNYTNILEPNLNENSISKSINFQANTYCSTLKKSDKKKITRIKFTSDEDKQLLYLVSVYGEKDWIKISQELSKNCKRQNNKGQNIIRNARQCKDRYFNYLSPEIRNSEWTPEEDHLLELQVLTHLHKWKDIKEFFPGRSEVALRNRFNFIHKNHFNTIKPLIHKQIEKNTICQQYTPNEIVKQAFDLRNSLTYFNIDKNTPTKSPIFSNINLSTFQKLYNKYNKNLNGDIFTNNIQTPNITCDTTNLLLSAVREENFKNKVEYIQKELASLSSFVETRALFESVIQPSNFTAEYGSDYDPYMINL